MKDFLEYVVKHLVDHPESVRVDVEERELTPDDRRELSGEGQTEQAQEQRPHGADKGKIQIYRLRVAEGDVGKIIGRDGKTASALRLLLRAVAAKEGKRAKLHIEE